VLRPFTDNRKEIIAIAGDEHKVSFDCQFEDLFIGCGSVQDLTDFERFVIEGSQRESDVIGHVVIEKESQGISADI
jgi:hypothetical protein